MRVDVEKLVSSTNLPSQQEKREAPRASKPRQEKVSEARKSTRIRKPNSMYKDYVE
jgi:hypothetical protein